MLITIAVYIVLSILGILYIKKDEELPLCVDFIVVLSASLDKVTRNRLDKAIELMDKYPNAILVLSGKREAAYMEKYIQQKGVSNYLVQKKSTNTFEDAVYLNKIIKNINSKFILVTSSAHQRRAAHTFSKVFRRKFWNQPTNDILTYYSPLTPVGWLATLFNLFKDIKYNRSL